MNDPVKLNPEEKEKMVDMVRQFVTGAYDLEVKCPYKDCNKSFYVHPIKHMGSIKSVCHYCNRELYIGSIIVSSQTTGLLSFILNQGAKFVSKVSEVITYLNVNDLDEGKVDMNAMEVIFNKIYAEAEKENEKKENNNS